MNDNKKYDIGVIIARFQVPTLSVAHRELIGNVIATHSKTMILLGVSPTLGTKENPLPYIVREKMIRQAFPTVHIASIMDIPSNSVWSSTVDRTIQSLFPLSTICLYGGRDSFQEAYNGSFDTYEIFEKYKISGSEVRDAVYKNAPMESKEFREGVVYACYNQYPKVFTTTDTAIIKNNEVLMGKKVDNNDGLYCFIGGFVDPTDNDYEESAKREVLEETGLEVDNLEYQGSYKINDWRYADTTDKIITIFYKCKYVFGTPTKNEEFTKMEWVPINKDNIKFIKPEHKQMFKKLLEGQIK